LELDHRQRADDEWGHSTPTRADTGLFEGRTWNSRILGMNGSSPTLQINDFPLQRPTKAKLFATNNIYIGRRTIEYLRIMRCMSIICNLMALHCFCVCKAFIALWVSVSGACARALRLIAGRECLIVYRLLAFAGAQSWPPKLCRYSRALPLSIFALHRLLKLAQLKLDYHLFWSTPK
jgi:hypothetical protein